MMLRRFMNGFWISMVIVGSVVSIGGYGVVEAKDVQTTKINKKTQKEAEEFINSLGKTAFGVIKRPKITAEEVQQEFRSLLKKNFALKRIAIYSLGGYFRLLSKKEKKDFLECFENMLIKFYSSRFTEYKTAKLEFVGSRKKSSIQVMVDSEIVRPNKENVSVVWSVYATDEGLKVYDVIIGNVSVSNMYRSQFMSKISKEGKISEKGLKKFLADFRKKYGQNEEQKQ